MYKPSLRKHILLKQAIEYPNVNLKKKVPKTKILSGMPVLVPYKPLERKRGKETTEHSLMFITPHDDVLLSYQVTEKPVILPANAYEMGTFIIGNGIERLLGYRGKPVIRFGPNNIQHTPSSHPTSVADPSNPLRPGHAEVSGCLVRTFMR
ncbi:hypothetical protein BGZ91_002706 [Linnemannia elongata]|nr:hypothetical protein BGZ91_002706 [Linnemannia elongata]